MLPFIRELGYDVFNPAEVVPEYTADVGIKRGEKVDYAIFRDGNPIILIECKPVGSKLATYSSQLYRYFSTTHARIAVLTDGLRYHFYSDLHETNKLDESPFFSFSLERLRKDDAVRIEQFAKPQFNLDELLIEAESLKCRAAIRGHFARELADPSDAFVRHFADALHEGRMTQGVLDRYRLMVKAALGDYVNSAVERRLQSALGSAPMAVATSPEPLPADAASPDDDAPAQEDDGVETTLEELEAFFVVKAILRDLVAPQRIASRDVRSYFGVLLDDNNRKPICRLWFNRSQKYLGVFNETKAETRIPIGSVDEIFHHAEALRASLEHALGAETLEPASSDS